MKFYNLKDNSQIVDFETAVRTGLGNKQGLFFPKKISAMDNIDSLLELPTQQRNFEILKTFVSENISHADLMTIIENTFTFPTPLKTISSNQYCLELFHGPTLAFKDFGANFMANCLQTFSSTKKITILTATSGDTGAAVAHAFYGVKNIQVVILFPKGKISQLQQKMFTTLGNNIHTIAIDGTFDDCQNLVKQSFDQKALVDSVGLNSANSINISRLLAQVCYYFDAFSQLPQNKRENVVISVPSGNFGNLCAATIARVLGLPIKRLIAATNINDTVPRYLQTGSWSPKKTIPTLSNAMDVSQPNNWPRIEYLIESGQLNKKIINACSVDEKQTQRALESLYQQNYTSEPHAAVAYHGLLQSLSKEETGIFLATAHPAKFKDTVEGILDIKLEVPTALARCATKDDLSHQMPTNFNQLQDFLQQLYY